MPDETLRSVEFALLYDDHTWSTRMIDVPDSLAYAWEQRPTVANHNLLTFWVKQFVAIPKHTLLLVVYPRK